MSRCDIAITSRGRTCYELAMMGIPAIAMAQNRREETHGFANHENGFNYLGLKPSTAIIKANLDLYLNSSKAERQALQNVLLSKDLRNGRERSSIRESQTKIFLGSCATYCRQYTAQEILPASLRKRAQSSLIRQESSNPVFRSARQRAMQAPGWWQRTALHREPAMFRQERRYLQ